MPSAAPGAKSPQIRQRNEMIEGVEIDLWRPFAGLMIFLLAMSLIEAAIKEMQAAADELAAIEGEGDAARLDVAQQKEQAAYAALLRMRARGTKTRTRYVYAPRTSFQIGKLLGRSRDRNGNGD